MAKPNSIRKKALDFARKRQWDKALVEFNKLVEVEQHNPNLFNEIGDLHIKVDDKREAFKSFHKAVDAYTRVGLHNNAVAVCKKIIRLNPSDHVVYGKLARLRHQQGFHREAEKYSLDFFGKTVQGPDVASDDLRELAVDIALAAEKSPAVLEKAAEYLINCDFRKDAGSVLEKLLHYHSSEGNTAEIEKIKNQMESIGFVPSSPQGQEQSDKLETVESHRSQVGGFGDKELDTEMKAFIPPHIRRGNDEDVAKDYGVVDIGATGTAPASDIAPGETSDESSDDAPEEGSSFSPDTTGVVFDEPASQQTDPDGEPGAETVEASELAADESADAYDSPGGLKEYVIPDKTELEPPESPVPTDAIETAGTLETEEVTGMDDILGSTEPTTDDASIADMTALASKVTADVDEDDYRSHYDLGMAYIEMELLSEAIREFQFAANSAPYRIKSLEMIGRCFVQQDKPELAIKQLSRGLALVGGDNGDALGIKYNLGLAYEMIGDVDTAQTFFEEVYVVDVTFRDIEEKIKKYAT